MTADLCTICGASWDCEHKPKAAVELVEDAHGPPVAVRKAPPTIGRVELESRLMAAVAERPGSNREELARACGCYVNNGYSTDPTTQFKETLRRLVNSKLLLQTLHGRVYLFESVMYRQDLGQRIEQAERTIEWFKTELEQQQKRIARRESGLAKLRKDLEKAS